MSPNISRRSDWHRLPTDNPDARWRRRGYIAGRITQLILAFSLGALAHALLS